MQLQKFDLLAIKGHNDIISTLVKKYTKNPYSHVAIVLDDWHVIDTNIFQPVRVRHFNYKLGDFDCFRLRTSPSSFKIRDMTEFIQIVLNSKYDILEALGFRDVPHRYICLSLYKEMLRSAGIYLMGEKFSILHNYNLMKVGE